MIGKMLLDRTLFTINLMVNECVEIYIFIIVTIPLFQRSNIPEEIALYGKTKMIAFPLFHSNDD